MATWFSATLNLLNLVKDSRLVLPLHWIALAAAITAAVIFLRITTEKWLRGDIWAVVWVLSMLLMMLYLMQDGT